MAIATCIGCGCDDCHACVGDDGPCSWLAVDYGIGRGVCSYCGKHLERWNAGDRAVVMLVAKINKDGEVAPYFIERNDMVSFPHLFDVEAGDKFSIEWMDMTQDQFEALPQFAHVRLSKDWLKEMTAADEAETEGRMEDAKVHQVEAKRLEGLVETMGFDVREIVDSVIEEN